MIDAIARALHASGWYVDSKGAPQRNLDGKTAYVITFDHALSLALRAEVLRAMAPNLSQSEEPSK